MAGTFHQHVPCRHKNIGISVDPFNIQIMNKPESEDEEAVRIEE